jgi:CheY-like chemotaxis protein
MDDEPTVRRAAAWLLRDAGYQVECAREGAEAVQLYRQAIEAKEPFDAVILDLTVSDGMSGQECIGQLRAMDPGVRAVVCSGYSDEPIMADLARHGFRAAVVKPFAIEELLAALRKALSP